MITLWEHCATRRRLAATPSVPPSATSEGLSIPRCAAGRYASNQGAATAGITVTSTGGTRPSGSRRRTRRRRESAKVNVPCAWHGTGRPAWNPPPPPLLQPTSMAPARQTIAPFLITSGFNIAGGGYLAEWRVQALAGSSNSSLMRWTEHSAGYVDESRQRWTDRYFWSHGPGRRAFANLARGQLCGSSAAAGTVMRPNQTPNQYEAP